jgi:hypothetical protein
MTDRLITALMAFVAATLVVASALHLLGVGGDGSAPFHPDRAGIAEAVIAVVLAVGALALLRGARAVALGAVVFAIAGFVVGLSMTVRGGDAGDIAYHAATLPVLLLALAGLSGTSRRGRASRRTA